MAIIKPSTRYTTHKIGSSSDPTKPIGENDLVIIESVDETAYPDADDRVRVAKQRDIVEDYFGVVVGKNKYNKDYVYDPNSLNHNRYYYTESGLILTGPDGKVSDHVLVNGSTYYVLSTQLPLSINVQVHAYTEDHTWISIISSTVVSTVGGKNVARRILTPSNCKFIAFWTTDTNEVYTIEEWRNSLQVEESISTGVNTSYEPYSAALNIAVANGAVTSDKLAPASVTSDKLDTASVTSDKLATGAVTLDKLDPNIELPVDEEIETYFGTVQINGRNKFNPALNTTLYNRYIDTTGIFLVGLSGRILGYVPVVVGRTYILWLNPKEGKGTPPRWYESARFLKFYAYNGSTYSMMGGYEAGGHNVNTWSSGEVPNVVSLDAGRTYKIQIPTGCTHISCWIADAGETDNPQTSYYESMADFNSNVMLEEYADYASAAKTSFAAYTAPVIKLLPDKIDMGSMVSDAVSDALAEFEADTDNYGDLSITGDKIAEGTIPASKLSMWIQKGKVYAYNDGSHCYIRSAFNTQYDALIKLSMTHVTGIGYTAEYLIPKSNAEADFTTGLVTIKSSVDDHYPSNMNQGYIGGNHGLSWTYKLTKTAHGFTYSDIGTVWLDERTPSPYEYAIVSILDENNIVVVGKDVSVTDIWSLQQAITGATLTESGGSLRTFTGWTSTSVLFTKDATKFPHVSTPIKKLLVNGDTEMQTGISYYCDFIDLISEYCILHPGRMRQYAVDNVGTFTANVTQAEADANIARHSNQRQLFRCSSYGAMLVDYLIEFYMQTNIGYIGFVQADGIGSSAGSKIYAPRAAVDDAKSVDCRIRAYSDPFAIWEPHADAMIDPNKWTDRVIQLKYNTSTGALNYGWVLGYIEDYALAKQSTRETNTSQVWSIYSSRKNYPRLISNKTVPAGTIIHAISYRQPVHPELWSAKATAVYFHEVAGYLYVYMDYHQSLIGSSSVVRDVVALPSKYAGLTFTLYDKTDNIEVLIEDYIPSGGIALDIDCTSEVYGYCILKVKL